MSKKFLSLLGLLTISATADELQSKLMSIASQEAQIANIGANKYMMLYGVKNPIPVIQRWNQIEHHPALSDEQIAKINALELDKQEFLKQVSN